MTIKTIHIPAGGGFDNVTVETSQPVDPGPGEITVRLRASSLNFHDYMVVKGITGPKERRIPMSDGAGEVTAVGDGVREFAVGDHVVSTFFPDWLDGEAQVEGFGRVPGDGIDGYAREQVTAPTTAFTRAPRGWSHAEAATLTTAGLTAWRALFVDAALKPGSVVLVQGTGGVSVFALQLAKLAGARVIATSSSDAKLERLRELGADEVINYRQDPEWGMTARRLTDGRGVDHVLDVTAVPEGTSAADGTRAIVTALVRFIQRRRDNYVAIIRSGRSVDPALEEVVDAMHHTLSLRVLESIGVPDPGPTALMLTRSWLAGVEEAALLAEKSGLRQEIVIESSLVALHAVSGIPRSPAAP